jgi:hypothetical protein
MADNIEKKNSSLIPNDDFLNWSDYDEEYEEEDNKVDIKKDVSNSESTNFQKKESAEIEEDSNNDAFSNNKEIKDYSYSSNTYRKGNYLHNRSSYTNKKFTKQSRPFNKPYENSTYYYRNTYFKQKKSNNDIYNNKDYYKYNKEHNYESKKSYKTVEKNYDYENQDIYDKKSDKKNFGDKYYNKKFPYKNKNNEHNFRSTVSYNTREFIEDKKYPNKNNKFKNEPKRFEKEEEIKERTEENISKPTFYNSKKNNNNDVCKSNEETRNKQQSKYIKIEDFIEIENLVNNINSIVKETYANLKSKINKNIEEQYGTLNINAKTYIPRRKILNESNPSNNDINFNHPNYLSNNIPPQNYMPQYY